VKPRPANFDANAGAETPGQFDAALPRPAPEKKARPVVYDPTAGAESPGASHETEAAEGSFWDLLDIVNPLQHLPVVGTIYRRLSGDTISGPARIMGGALFGGPIGMLGGVAETLFEQTSGADYGTQLVNLVTGAPGTKSGVAQTAMVDAAKAGAASGAPAAAASVPTAVARAAAQATSPTVQPGKAAANDSAALAENAAKPAGPSALFHSLQKATKAGPIQASGPVIEIRPRREEAQSAAGPTAAAGATDGMAQKAGSPPALPQQLVADMMMGALDKYAKMKQSGGPAARIVDQAL
jgi:hypothetical protein